MSEIYEKRLNEIKDLFLDEPQVPRAEISFDPTPYVGKLPRSIFDLWDAVGDGVFLNGYFQLCDPAPYDGILQQVLQNDPQLRPSRTHVIGFSSFGTLLAWNEEYQNIRIDLVYGQVSCRRIPDTNPEVDPSIAILVPLLLADGPSYDVLDGSTKGLFKRATKKLGHLRAGEIFGFKPVLALGGKASVEHVERYEAVPHMSILAQSTRFDLMDMTPYPPRAVREIGG